MTRSQGKPNNFPPPPKGGREQSSSTPTARVTRNRKKNQMKAIIIALVLSVASLFAGAQTAQSAEVYGIYNYQIFPTIPAGWELLSIEPVPNSQYIKMMLFNRASGQLVAWILVRTQ